MSFLFKSAPSADTSTPSPVAPISPPVSPAPSATAWMDWMHSNIGQPEVTGAKATAFDILVFSHTSDDEVEKSGVMASGCAATVCAALELNGYKSTHRADAKSYDSYGSACEDRYGAIKTFKWDGGGRHVTFFVKDNGDGTIDCLGGNQSHKLQVSTYSKKYVVATRWPVKA